MGKGSLTGRGSPAATDRCLDGGDEGLMDFWETDEMGRGSLTSSGSPVATGRCLDGGNEGLTDFWETKQNKIK